SCSTRNIPFNTSQQDLHALFLPYGPIYSIHIPLETNTNDANVTNNREEPSPKIELSTKITIPNPRIRVHLDPITAQHPCADALRVLLWANNNPSVAELWEEWWKEEIVALLQAEKIKPENEKEELKGKSRISRVVVVVVMQRRRVMQDEQRNQFEKLAPRKKRKVDKVYKLKKDVKEKDLKDELCEKVQARLICCEQNRVQQLPPFPLGTYLLPCFVMSLFASVSVVHRQAVYIDDSKPDSHKHSSRASAPSAFTLSGSWVEDDLAHLLETL
ncbi:hypothetical protein GG344DRAFT_71566, partial [Lentinula edodes]